MPWHYLWIISQIYCAFPCHAVDKAMKPHLTASVTVYNRLMANSFQLFTGQSILGAANAGSLNDQALAQAMFDAPQAIVSHGIGEDPIFRYANAQALKLWEMDWDNFTRLPSRLSAEAAGDIQSDRDTLLKTALEKGWVDNYTGVRISSAGQRFDIRNTVLWNVVDDAEIRHGQAAFIRDWRFL